MTENRKIIVAISGSIRSNSTNELILKFIADLYNESLDIQLYKDIEKLPHFNPDLNDKKLPLSVKNFLETIEKADGVIICTPEYVFSLPAILKNAIEWAVATIVFSDKPTAIIVASGMGEKAYESLTLIMKTVGAKIGEDASLLVSGARSKLNAQGKITDENTLHQIYKFMRSFIETIT